MSGMTLFLLAAGLSMDAFAVSITNGFCCRGLTKTRMLCIAAVFGGLQGLMPAAGYLLGKAFAVYIERIDHYIALVLLGCIGGKMIADACHPEETEPFVLKAGLLLLQGLATSLDAMAVGISLAALPDVSISTAACCIAGITAVVSFCGAAAGRRLGTLLGSRAQIAGGLILIGIGVRIFLSHMLG